MATPALFMDYITVRGPIEYGFLAMFPIVLTAPDFDIVEDMEVIGCGKHNECIHPIETGRMDRVKIVNRGNTRFAVFDGAILRGGAADRMLLADAIIEKDEEVVLPAASVDVRRWDCQQFPSGKFQVIAEDPTFPKSAFAPCGLRRHRLIESIHDIGRDGVARFDQESIWRYIMDLFRKSTLKSERYDLMELYTHWSYLLDEYTTRFAPPALQVGSIVFHKKKKWHMEIFQNTKMFAKVYPGILKSYAFDAVMNRAANAGSEGGYKWTPSIEDAVKVFAKIKFTKMRPLKYHTAPSRNGAFYMDTKHILGTALISNEKLIHMTACPV